MLNVHLSHQNGEDVTVKDLKEYRIPFVGLKKGVHYFDYEISQEFFSFFEASPVHESSANILLRFDKKEDFFILKFDIGGSVKVSCDRCLENIEMPIEAEYTVYVKFEDARMEGKEEEENDIIFLSMNETELDVSQLIYEFFHFSLPMRKNCQNLSEEERPCNTEVLQYLNDEQQKTEREEGEIDPRWQALRHLK